MAALEPRKLWWTAEEIAASGLPMLPGTKRAVNFLADREGWRAHPGCARRKPGRGGGWQYHWSVLPSQARSALLKEASETPDPRPDRGTAWAAFDALKEATKEKARARLKAVQMVEALHAAGTTHVAAAEAVAREHGVSSRSIYNWLALTEGIAPEDRLAYLVPGHAMVERKAPDSAAARPFLDHLKSNYLRLEQPTFKECYRDAREEAEKQGWQVLAERTARRRIEAEVPRVTRVFAREGVAGLEKCFPPQIRDRSGMTAMEGVNADCHKIDVFVKWPDGTINRPQIVAFQDIYSGKMLSWRVDHDPNKVMVMAAFGELIERWGIPRHCLFDNGREFANKWMTAGTKTRFRFKVREDDPVGVLPLLGIQVHWARPAHGQAKPIERGFGDFANDIAKDPEFSGAYVGRRTDAKPENYQSRAIPHEIFLKVLAAGIDRHNARDGRLSPTALGRSFDETFEESYSRSPIRRATAEQRRLWMMGQHVGTLNRNHGRLHIYGNHYHSAWMSEIAGRRVVARFDPEDLHAGVHLYGVDGQYLGFAECQQKVGFFDVTEARHSQRRRAQIQKAEKQLVAAHRPVPIEEIAARRGQRAPEPTAPLEAKVVSPVFGSKGTRRDTRSPVCAPETDPTLDAAQEAMILDWQPKVNAAPQSGMPETARERFFWACDVLARSEAGKPIGTEEARQLREYMKSSEYESQRRMFEAFGEDGVG